MTTENENLADLQEQIAYRFRNPELLRNALIHPSYQQENPEIKMSNQRLEFLGDSILGALLAERLYFLFPDAPEGALSKWRSSLVKGRFLSKLGEQLQLGSFLLLGQGEIMTGGRNRRSILEDAFEALVGAIYLDSDLATTSKVVLPWYGDLRIHLELSTRKDNPKGRLQEQVQAKFKNGALRYEVCKIDGPPHFRTFEVALFLHEKQIGKGKGSSKKEAEEMAAKASLENWPEVLEVLEQGGAGETEERQPGRL